MPRRLLFPCIAALGFLLSGCFVSEQPRFPPSSAAPAFGEGGRYGVFEHIAGDRYRRHESFLVRRRGDGGYEFVNEKGEVLSISFHTIDGGLFVGQAKTGKDKDGFEYAYTLLRVVDNEALMYLPQCDKQDEAALTGFGVEFKGKDECIIDRVAEPLKLFGSVTLGEPFYKMVRE